MPGFPRPLPSPNLMLSVRVSASAETLDRSPSNLSPRPTALTFACRWPALSSILIRTSPSVLAVEVDPMTWKSIPVNVRPTPKSMASEESAVAMGIALDPLAFILQRQLVRLAVRKLANDDGRPIVAARLLLLDVRTVVGGQQVHSKVLFKAPPTTARPLGA